MKKNIDDIRKPATSEVIKPKKPPANPYKELHQRQYKEREKERIRKKIENTPEKIRARNAVRDAIRNGTLAPQKCKKCEGWPTEAHHESYDLGQELNIVWLCKKCHDIISAKAWREAWRKKNVDQKKEKSDALIIIKD